MSEERNNETQTGDRSASEDTTRWLASGIVRLGLAIVGVVLLLFAAGRIAGIDLLEMVLEVLTSSIGRWILLAFVALVLLAVAVRGFSSR
ncbi:hypothetical protein BRC68_07565 [Halobacteriales archaeon QH_6_64_20]|jgi:hypothetical protein|nr:MAG: hypothetical protein BRC68_07565 [Halobacteriales archaeon QH_6_64_20]